MTEMNQNIYNFITKQRKLSFHIILTFLTAGIWIILYFSTKILYPFHTKYLKKLNQSQTNNKAIKKTNNHIQKLNVLDLIASNRIDSFVRDENFRKEIKEYLVQVISYCPEHKKFHHKIFYDDMFQHNKKNTIYPKLSTAIIEGLLNDGCKCTIATYYPESEDIKFDEHGLTKETIKKAKEDELWLKKRGITITTHAVSGYNPYKNAVPKEVYQFAYSDKKSKIYPKDYIVFDTETTGLEPEIDKIIEISAIKYINNEPIDNFSVLVNPKQKLDPFITSLTGITDRNLRNQPTIDEVLPKFFDFIEDYVLVAHNTPFDIKMVACECYRNNITMCNNRLIDTVPLAKRMISSNDVKDYKLTTLKKYFGIKIQSHRALQDCEMCAIVYQQYLKFETHKNSKKKLIIIDEETGEVLQEN